MGTCQQQISCQEKLDEQELNTPPTTIPKSSEGNSHNIINDILEDFIISADNLTIEDPIYGEISLLVSNKQKNFMLALKQLVFYDLEEYLYALQLYKNRFYGLNHYNLFIIHILSNKFKDDFFQTQYLIDLYLDYPLRTFRNEMLYRKQAYFDEMEIIYLMDSLISPLSMLQSKGIPHGNLSFDNIYIATIANGKKALKIMDPLLKPYEFNLLEEFFQSFSIDKLAYFSPEQLILIQNKELKGYNQFKSDVFTLGMLMLELCTRSNCKQVYNITNWSIKINTLNDLIAKVQAKYSDSVVLILKSMLQINPKKRPDFLELDENFNNYTDLYGKRISETHKLQDYQYCVKSSLACNNNQALLLKLPQKIQNRLAQINSSKLSSIGKKSEEIFLEQEGRHLRQFLQKRGKYPILLKSASWELRQQ